MSTKRINVISIFSNQLISRGSNILINAVIEVAKTWLDIKDKTDTIDNNVKKLIKKYYSSGIEHLENAKHSKSNSIQKDWLEKAIENFINATKVESINVVLDSTILIACCFLMLDEKENALRYLNKAYSFIDEYFFEISLDRGNMYKTSVGIIDTFWTALFQSNDIKNIEIYTNIAKELYKEFYEIATILNKENYKVNLPSESKIKMVREYFQRQSDLNSQRSRGM